MRVAKQQWTEPGLFPSVVLVPCPGADPYDTWTREPLPRDVFESTFDWNKPRVKVGIPKFHTLSTLCSGLIPTLDLGIDT